MFDPRAGLLSRGSKQVRLTPLGTKILTALCESPDSYLDQTALYERVWGLRKSRTECAGKVDNQITFLRRAIAEFGDEELIDNVRGFGFRLRRPEGTGIDGAGLESQRAVIVISNTALLAESQADLGWETDDLLIFEGRYPLEAMREHRQVFRHRLASGVRTLFVLGPDDASTAATLLNGLFDDWFRQHKEVRSLLADNGFELLLRHLWIVLAARVSTIPLYVLHANDGHRAKCYTYQMHEGSAVLHAEGIAAQSNARDICDVLPAAQRSLTTMTHHPVVFFDERLGAKPADDFVKTFRSQCGSLPWRDECEDLLAAIVATPRKPTKRADAPNSNRRIGPGQNLVARNE